MNPIYEGLRPHPQQLALLLLAGVADRGDGGPWLYISRSADKEVTVHHIHTTRRMEDSPTRMRMISGEEALAYAWAHRWGDPLNPLARELRGLAVHAMLLRDVSLWATEYDTWHSWQGSPEQVAHDHSVKAAVRTLRWQWAEQWLKDR